MPRRAGRPAVASIGRFSTTAVLVCSSSAASIPSPPRSGLPNPKSLLVLLHSSPYSCATTVDTAAHWSVDVHRRTSGGRE
ncbi:hypothetical protein OH77DRAFT_44085 [Trametes cingulata]|nr:hypothetical protein OH77DRAFT_44085 [Trametes cingulata]